MRRYGTGLAIALALTACGGSGGSPGAQPSPSETASPTPTLPSVGQDKKLVKRAVVTAAELGKPWVQPKEVNKTKVKKGELCPGQANSMTIAPPRADDVRRLTEGTKPAAPIASFGVRAYAFGEEQKWRDAFAAADKGCASWKSAEGAHVTLETIADPPVIAGADEVLVHIERVYADKTKKTLYYVRHYWEARIGRIVATVELAYIQPKSDPTGKDLDHSAPLVVQQVAKAKATFGL